ncbi:MAG: oligosaccharide repeat unit polymerase [Patescibacteria group bacterium]
MKLNWRLSGQSVRETLDLLIEFAYLATIFLIPLWFAHLLPTYNIFELNKIILFKILVCLLLFFTAVKVIFFIPVRPRSAGKFFKKHWLIPTIFIVGLSLTLLGSLNPMLSFYGIIERQQGLSSYLFYFLWFVLVSFNILTVNNKRRRGEDDKLAEKTKRVALVAVLSASLVSLYGLLQIFGLDFTTWPEPPLLTHRVLSSFGQPNFLASFLLLVIPLSFYLFYESRRPLIKFAYFLAAASQLVCLVLTGSRGGLIALLIAAALFLVYLLFSSSWRRWKKYLVISLFLLGAIGALGALNYLLPNHLSSLFDLNSGSVGARVNFYLAAAEAIKERPLLGYGLENAGDVFIRYYQPDWGVYGEVGQSADRAHNLFLDILLNAGAVGLLLFTVLYYYFFRLARDNIRQKKQSALSLALAFGAAAYLSSLLFSFAFTTGEIYFWLFLALLVALNRTDSGRETGEETSAAGQGYKKLLGLKIIGLLLISFLIFRQINREFKTLMADYYFNAVYFTLTTPDYFTALTLDSYVREQKTNPVNQEAYDYFLGERLSEFYPSIVDLAPQQAVARRLKEIDASLSASGYKNLLLKAKINNALGNFSVAQDYLSSVIALTPNWPLVYLEQGKIWAAQGDSQEAIVAYQLATLNLPAISDSRLNDLHRQNVLHYLYFIDYRIAALYETAKNYPAAEKYYRLAYGSNPDDFTLLKKIADTYYRRGDLKTAREYVAHGLTRNPADYNWSLALAALYRETGDHAKALKYLEKARELAPDNQEILNWKEDYGE